MKAITKLKDILFIFIIIVFLFAFQAYSQYSVSGTVRYSDNLEIVTQGKVRAYSQEGVLLSVTNINPDGSYRFEYLEPVATDLLGTPNLEPEEEEDSFVPTYHPNAQMQANAVTVFPDHTLTGIDIYVERIELQDNNMTTYVSGNVTLNHKPISDAIILAKLGGKVIGFGITDSEGNYKIKNIPAGDYILVIHRAGTQVITDNVTISNKGLTGYNVNLEKPASGLINNKFEFKLSQNYPNPFNPSTIIAYSVNKAGNVNISVYNSAGQMVKELVNGNMSSGSYNVEFNGSSLASGIYYYKMVSAGYTETRKMILIK